MSRKRGVRLIHSYLSSIAFISNKDFVGHFNYNNEAYITKDVMFKQRWQIWVRSFDGILQVSTIKMWFNYRISMRRLIFINHLCALSMRSWNRNAYQVGCNELNFLVVWCAHEMWISDKTHSRFVMHAFMFKIEFKYSKTTKTFLRIFSNFFIRIL